MTLLLLLLLLLLATAQVRIEQVLMTTAQLPVLYARLHTYCAAAAAATHCTGAH
jgi:hypothetical protein